MTKNKQRVILGINPSHNTSAAIMIDDQIVAAAQEERFSRKKNHIGIPVKSIEFCLKVAGVTTSQLDSIVIVGATHAPFYLSTLEDLGTPQSKNLVRLNSLYNFLRFSFVHELARYFPTIGFADYAIHSYVKRFLARPIYRKYSQLLANLCEIDPGKITYLDHHEAHAATSYFGSGFANDEATCLIFTSDGGGDENSATLRIGRNSQMRLIAKTPFSASLGYLYMYTTWYLGLKPVEDEYKVMGLAPYAPKKLVGEVYAKLEKFINLDRKKLVFKSPINTEVFYKYLPKLYANCRFDVIAAAIQKLAEDMICEWVDAAIRKYHILTVSTSGGVFANVKINQKVASLPKLKNAFFAPSPGDEMNCLGACFKKYTEFFPNRVPQPLKHLYLGPQASEVEINQTIKKARELGFKVKKLANINQEVAKLLAKGEIVARFVGRLEFGARALGNRSILADASRLEVKDEINKMIKSRDFWMPFAPSILEEYRHRYLVNPKNLSAPFMILAFDTTPAGQKDLVAAVHPYDKTCRPQLVSKSNNPNYYNLLTEFSSLTGRAGFLNTSFNLHGEPIVCSPDDALYTFANSGLKYLQIEDFLIEKASKN